MTEFHTKVSVLLTLLDHPGEDPNPHGPVQVCPACGYEVTTNDRSIPTGGGVPGIPYEHWHAGCLLNAIQDPVQVWPILAAQIARKPSRYAASAIRVVLTQLLKMLADEPPARAGVGVAAFIPYAFQGTGDRQWYAVPELLEDGTVVFKPGGPF